MAVFGAVIFLIDGSFREFIFYLSFGGLGEKPEALRSVTQPRSCFANYVTVMSQPP